MFTRKLLLVALACATSAAAENPPETVSDEIRSAALMLSLYSNELDCEKGGFIQTGEPQEHFAPIFMTLDIDKSKLLSRSELVNMPHVKYKSLLGVTFSRMDKNGDGAVTPEELQYYLDDAIARIDGNGDGDVYPAEYEHALTTGTVLKTVAAPTSHKKKQPDFVPPWVRHAKAINHMKANNKLQTAVPSKTPATVNLNQ